MKKIILCAIIAIVSLASASAFDKGWVMNIKANVGGSATLPSISDSDLAKLGANKMEGMVGFIGGGKAEIGYIFDSPTYFNLSEDNPFSGVGVFGQIGVTQGYAGQISGSLVDVGGNQEQVDVFVNVYYTPVITAGATAKAYFFKNRLAVGLSAGMKLIADTAPEYEIYSTAPDTIPAEVGVIIVNDFMMDNMNPIMGNFELFAEYSVPILPTMELILGGYGSFNVFKPGYVTMPKKVLDMAIANFQFDPETPMDSYFINSFDFGLTFALGFRL